MIRNKIGWAGNELSIWDKHKEKVEVYHIADNIDKQALRRALDQELLKHTPHFSKVIEAVVSGGASELLGFWQKVIDGKIESKSGKPFSKRTLKEKKNTLKLVQRYAAYANITLSFESMDMPFYQDFSLWMKTIGNDGAPYDQNTRSKIVRDLKAILNLARVNQYFSHNKYDDWSAPKTANEVVLLSKPEFMKVLGLKLTGTKEDVRDLFVMASFCGARISDFKTFTHENVFVDADGIQKIRYVQEKTGARAKFRCTRYV